MSKRNVSLFSDLPAPSGRARLLDEDEPADANPATEERPDKRVKFDEDHVSLDSSHQDIDAPSQAAQDVVPNTDVESAPPPQSADQIKAALTKIAFHIGNASKFQKASGLLRQLLDSGAVGKDHRQQLFDTIAAAFRNPEHCTELTLRKHYMRLVQSIERRSELFHASELQQLEVYAIYGQLQNELHTDDSFVFNKVLRKVHELFAQLPEASEDDDAAYTQLHDPDAATQQAAAEPTPPAAAAGAEPASTEAANVEQDPFGLDSLLGSTKPDKKAAAAEPASTVWSPAQQLCMRRQALLACLETAKGHYKLPWAWSSIELAIENVHKQRQLLCSQQRQQLEDMYRFVQEQRIARRTGSKTSKLDNAGITSFDKAREKWSTAVVSHRGKIGAQGDAKSNNWLG